MSEEKLQTHKLFLGLLRSSLSLLLTCYCLSCFECQQQGQKFVSPFMASPTVVNNTCQEPKLKRTWKQTSPKGHWQNWCTIFPSFPRVLHSNLATLWQIHGSQTEVKEASVGLYMVYKILSFYFITPNRILVSKQKDFTSLLRTVPFQ